METEIVNLVLTPPSKKGVAGSHSQALKPYFDLSQETITGRKLRFLEYLLCYMETEVVNLVLTPLQKMGVAGSHPKAPKPYFFYLSPESITATWRLNLLLWF